ncbi:MAG: hypothetical protein WKH64_16775 [Chloroflexia bacterium]
MEHERAEGRRDTELGASGGARAGAVHGSEAPDEGRAAPGLLRSARVVDVALLLGALCIMYWRILFANRPFGEDTGGFFAPLYSLLSRALLSGDIPGWNPHQMAGLPYAADPQIGLGYLPALLLLGPLPTLAALRLYMFFHFTLATFSLYGLGLTTGMSRRGAIVAGLTFGLSGPLFRTQQNFAFLQTYSLAAAILLLIEASFRARRRRTQMLYATGAALLFGQQMLLWPGQGTLYVGAMLSVYTVYRGWAAAHDRGWMWRRALGPVLLAAYIGVFGPLLNAWALVPKLLFLVQSNLQVGEQPPGTILGGLSPDALSTCCVRRRLRGCGPTALAVVALLGGAQGASRRGFWFAATVLCFILALGVQTPSTGSSAGWGPSVNPPPLPRPYPLPGAALAAIAGWGMRRSNKTTGSGRASRRFSSLGAAAPCWARPGRMWPSRSSAWGLQWSRSEAGGWGCCTSPPGRRVPVGALTYALCVLLAGELALNNLRLGPEVMVYADAKSTSSRTRPPSSCSIAAKASRSSGTGDLRGLPPASSIQPADGTCWSRFGAPSCGNRRRGTASTTWRSTTRRTYPLTMRWSHASTGSGRITTAAGSTNAGCNR